MPGVVVATYNVHGGVDGWGRPYDVVAVCRAVDADVLVLQESWGPDGGESLSRQVARELGYAVEELTLARGRMVAPPPADGARWGPPLWTRTHYGMRLDRRPRRPPAAGCDPARRGAPAPVGLVRGTWGIAVLSRLEMRVVRTIDFGQLPTDPARRGAIVAEVSMPSPRGGSLHVVGTHMAHLGQGSPRHIATLRRDVRDLVGRAAVVAGDMNLWGPPLSALLPGWRRAVRGRSWPAWSPVLLAQTDHLLVTGPVRVRHAAVLRLAGSDHYPVRASVEPA
jgi:endonuclease/exonuclease/phosphatase family metal-dependent hydrolase